MSREGTGGWAVLSRRYSISRLDYSSLSEALPILQVPPTPCRHPGRAHVRQT